MVEIDRPFGEIMLWTAPAKRHRSAIEWLLQSKDRFAARPLEGLDEYKSFVSKIPQLGLNRLSAHL